MSTRLEKVIPQERATINNAVYIDTQSEAIVIVGSGPVGMQLANELSRREIQVPVIVYGSEPVQPYNRVRLSDYLAGEVYRDALMIDESASDITKIEYRYNCAVECIDKKCKTITDISGRVQRYSKLVLVTGSTPFIPMFGNRHYKGIYTFRTLSEADALLSRKLGTRHTVVIGGGLLGLETARAMQKYHTQITIVEHSKWLMMQQLDEQGSAYLENFVNNHLETSEQGIYAIGECAEHKNSVYDLVKPGFEQAAVLGGVVIRIPVDG